MAKTLARLLARAAGVDPERLEGFGHESRQIVFAIGWSLVLVTFPLAFLAMAVYAGANLIAPGLEPAMRLVLAGMAGFAYALVIVVGVDRPLIITSDAADPSSRWSRVLMVAFRFVLVLITSYFIAHEIVLWMYRGLIVEAVSKVELEYKLQSSRQVEQLHDLDRGRSRAESLAEAEERLRRERKSLPAEIQAQLNAAHRCAEEASRLASALSDLLSRAAPENPDESAVLRRRLREKNVACKAMNASAFAAKRAWAADLDERIQESAEAKKAAEAMLAQSTNAAASQKSEIEAMAHQVAADGSARERAFARVKEDYPQIAFNAVLLQVGLLLLELLPLITKQLAKNNPAMAAIRRDLQREATVYRLQSAYTEAWEHVAKTAYRGGNMEAAMRVNAERTATSILPLQELETVYRQLTRSLTRTQEVCGRHPALAPRVVGLLERAMDEVLPKPAPAKSV
jgi:hypothetical protein